MSIPKVPHPADDVFDQNVNWEELILGEFPHKPFPSDEELDAMHAAYDAKVKSESEEYRNAHE